MTHDEPLSGRPEDSGLLSAVRAGDPIAALVDDEAWVTAMVDVEVALVRAQAALGVVPPAAAAAIARAARTVRIDVPALAVRSREAANPVVAFVPEFTRAVAALDPEAAEYVHRGGTSQDILDSAAMVISVRALRHIADDLERVAAALALHAERYRLTPMAARTLGQQAVPMSFGLKAANWLALVLDALDRVRRTASSLPAQLGGAAGTLAAYQEYADLAGQPAHGHGPQLAERFAHELGLRVPVAPWHARRTPLADIGWSLSVTTGALGKIAIDVQIMSRTEVAEVAEPAAEGRGASSAMPQKRNPVLSTLIVSAARQVPAHALVLAQSMLAEDERAPGAWQSEWQPLREVLRLTGGATRTAVELTEGLRVFPGRLRENLAAGDGTIVAERLGAVLAPLLGKAEAKRLLARMADRSHTEGEDFGELLFSAPELAKQLPDRERLRELLAPENYLGASGELVDRVLRRHRSSLGGT